MIFRDRADAGRALARRLTPYANRPDVLVLALPRGGVPVAYEVARALNAPLDVFLVRKLGALVDRTHRELTNEDIARIAGTYHAWRGERDAGEYADVAGFCASVTAEEIAQHRHVLTPGRYVGAQEAEGDDEPAEEKVARLTSELYEAFGESDRLQAQVRAQLGRLDG